MQEWELDVIIAAKGEYKGEVLKGKWKYKSATIVLTARHHESRQDVISTIKHELGHCLSLGWEYLLTTAVGGTTNNGEKVNYSQESFSEMVSLIDEHFASAISRIKLKGDK